MNDEGVETAVVESGVLPPENMKMRARAIREYGAKPTDAALMVFAKELAAGTSKVAAYRKIRPAATESTAKTAAYVLAQHPFVRRCVADHLAGTFEIMQALAPEAARRLGSVMLTAEKADVQRKAANDLLDRSGFPRRSELAISSHQIVSQMYEELASADVETIEGEVVEGDRTGDSRRQLTDGRSAMDALEADRKKWAELMPAASGPGGLGTGDSFDPIREADPAREADTEDRSQRTGRPVLAHGPESPDLT